jgi:hypothetical protein
MNTLDQSLRISTWASMGSLGSLGPNDDADGDHDYDGKSTSSRSTAMPATRQGHPTALNPRQSQSLLLQQQTRDAEAETMTTTPIGTSTTMENFKPEQGLESIPCRTTDVPTVQEHLEYYFGEGGPNSTHNTNQSTSAPSLIFFITPTYKRVTQMADLLRLSYTLDHDRAVYWIVVEDSNTCSKRVRDLLDRSGILYAHLAIKSPPKIQKLKGPSPPQAKGVAQRNAALDVVESLGLEGVLYFGDDDNAYDGTTTTCVCVCLCAVQFHIHPTMCISLCFPSICYFASMTHHPTLYSSNVSRAAAYQTCRGFWCGLCWWWYL